MGFGKAYRKLHVGTDLIAGTLHGNHFSDRANVSNLVLQHDG